MQLLVVEEDVGAESAQEGCLVAAAEEHRLVDANAPGAQGQDDALVRRRRTRGDQRGSNRVLVGRIRRLDLVNGFQNGLEWSRTQRSFSGLALTRTESLQALGLVDTLGFVAEDDRIAIKRNSELAGAILPRGLRQDGSGSIPGREHLADIRGVGRKKHIRTAWFDVIPGTGAICEHSALDVQIVMLDRIEYPQPGIGAVTRKQHNFDAGVVVVFII